MISTSTVPVTARTLEVPGARLHYEVRGAGPLVVLARRGPRHQTHNVPWWPHRLRRGSRHGR